MTENVFQVIVSRNTYKAQMMRSFSVAMLIFGCILAEAPASAGKLWCGAAATGASPKNSKCFKTKKQCNRYIKEIVRELPGTSGTWTCFPWYKM